MAAVTLRITRRRALGAAAVAAGAALVPAWPGRAAGGTAWLTLGRAATYGRLVATLTQAPDGRFRAAGAAIATRAFARWYAEQDAAVRTHADAVLDALRAPHYDAALGRGGAPPVGQDAPPSGAGAMVAGDGPPPGADYAALARAARPAGGPQNALVVAAVGLAAVTCTPPLDEDERPLVPAL